MDFWIPILAPLVVELLKWLIPQLPKPSLPILCTIAGALLETALPLLGHESQGLVQGAGLGAAGVGLREMLDQLGKRRMLP